ncbi:MAG: AAA family ATPase, partial [Planctomycetota bacterium]
IEKADPKVYDLLLQMMDEGFISDSSGEKVFFDKAIIIMTSNLGSKEIEKEKTKIGFNWVANQELSRPQLYTIVLDVLKNYFKPEFLNRITEIVLFNFLDFDMCKKIMQKFLAEFKELSLKSGFDLRISSDIVEFLTQKGFSREWGARELKRTMEKYFEAPFTDAIIGAKIIPPCIVRARIAGDAIKFISKKKNEKTEDKEKGNFQKK